MLEINTETCLKRKKIKAENIKQTDSTICLKKKTKTKIISKKIIARLKSPNILMNKIVF